MTRALLQTTRCKDKPKIVSMRKASMASQHGTQNIKTYVKTQCWTSLCAKIHNNT